MDIAYRIIYHEQVVKYDISLLSREWREKIRDAIKMKLSSHPEIFGVPLRNTLRGYRKLRVGDYRVIFLVESKTVKIFCIGHRSEVYRLINKRIA